MSIDGFVTMMKNVHANCSWVEISFENKWEYVTCDCQLKKGKHVKSKENQ